MTTTIDINGTLTLDQTSGAQSGDTAISSDLTGLSTAFKGFLNGLTGDLQLSAGQLAFADNVEAAVSGAGLVTVNPDGATISKLFFSDDSGAPLDGDQVIFNGSPLLTVDGGQSIYLHSYANGTIVLATTSATEGVGDVVAAFYLNAAGNNLSASVEMVTFQAIAHPDTTNPDDAIDWTNLLNVSASGSTSFNFDNLASGNNLFVAVGTSGAGLVVSGIHPVIKADGTLDNSGDNIKTSQGGVGATIGVNNQMFDPGETAVFSFVKGQAPGTYGDIDNMSYTDFIDVTDAKLFISQTEGTPSTNFTVKIGAFSAGGASTSPEAGRSYIDNNLASGANLGNDGVAQSALADDTAVAIVRVIIRDGNGQQVDDTIISDGFVTFNADGTITAQHLNDAYTVQWFTDNSGTQAVETFNRFQATAVVGKFDVGRVDLSQGVTVTESVGDKLHTNDDGPTAALTENAAKVLHDETSGVDANSNDQSGAAPAAFTALGTVLGWAASASAVVTPNSSFGTDGPGTQTLSLGVSGANADSGFDSLDHHNILLNVEGGLVVGRVDVNNDGNTTGEPIAFAISISQGGILSIAQYIAIAHPDGTNANDVATMLDSALLAKLHTTDGDGDTSDTSIAIGDKVQIRDDGPTAALTENAAKVLHDETAGVDANSNDQSGAAPAAFTALGTVLGWAASASAVVTPNSSFGTDGPGTQTLSLGVSGANADSGFDSLDHHNILLNVEGGLVVGRVDVNNDGNTTGEPIAFAISISQGGILSIAQYIAIAHPDGTNANDVATMLDSALLAKLHTTDGDGDTSDTSIAIGDKVQIRDDGPSIGANGTVPTVVVDESDFTTNGGPTDFSSIFTPQSGGADGTAAVAITFALAASGASGLTDTLTGQSVVLSTVGGVVFGKNGDGDTVFTISVDGNGNVTLDQSRAVVHPTSDPNESVFMSNANLVTLTATITDRDGDTGSASVNIGTAFEFKDDGPTITVPFDGDQNAGNGNGTHETLANTLNASVTGAFGYDIGHDLFAVYDATHSDFASISLSGNVTGLVPNTPTAFATSSVTLVAGSETATSATFNWAATYDANPDLAGVQPGTIAGTLSFNKTADTYTITLSDTADGFTKDLLHTSELLSKEPIGNTGHPNVVVEKLFDASTTPEQTDKDFFVQFTGNSNPNGSPFGFNGTGDGSPIAGDTFFNAGQQVTSNFEDWVSATQTTNGVAGDTIQKGEALTLRFFETTPGITTDDGHIAPTQTANDMAIEFDGIGNSEDLMLVLNLVNLGSDGAFGGSGTAADTFTTKAMYVENQDIYKASTPGGVPSPYTNEFSLDNNDGLVIVERNDYNSAGENWVLQGAQIMQSGNGLTGPDSVPGGAFTELATALNLQKAVGANGGSTTIALQNWDPTDNDVLKITDIAFTATQTVTPDAHLNFAVNIHDADGDVTGINNILVDVV
ncbi:DUF5801 repeats-in-toxin domain-containing protein [Mesorhizobium opportunistum]|uniref:DUF5801 domain-containing protein n=6 Tax=Mesorhizobium TaxID=68287 RepID=A0ABV1YJL8_9HYPH